MRPLLLRLLLSLALIIQGSASACAGISMAADMAPQTAMAGMDMHAGTDAHGCEDCPGCPDKHQASGDCGFACSMLAAIEVIPTHLQPYVPSEAQALMLQPSLVDFLQVPPTPPPIA